MSGSKPLDRTDPRISRARQLRKAATLEERIVWSQLKQLDVQGHFRRQAPIGPYFADFVHLGAKLIVELDGSQHGLPDRAARDAARTAYLEQAGFRVLRYWNNDVRENRDGIIETILNALHERLPAFKEPAP